MYSTVDNIISSIKLAWKYKILWVFALMLTASSAGMSSSSDFSPSKDTSKEDITIPQDQAFIGPYFIPREEIQFGKNVMGVADAPVIKQPNLVDMIPNIVIVGIAFLIFLPYVLYVGLISTAWAQASLVDGTIKGLFDEKLSLSELSKIGLKNINSFIKLTFLKIGIILPTVLIISIFGVIAFFISPLLMFIFLPVLILLIVFAFIFFSSVFANASRFIITKNENYKKAFNNGINLFKTNFGKYLKLSIGNCFCYLVFLSALLMVLLPVMLVIFLPMIAIYGAIAAAPQSYLIAVLIPIIIVLGLPAAILLGILSEVFAGFTNTFSQFTYSKLFWHLEGANLKGEQNAG